jgi:flagellar hook-associated protein 1 FlgK
MSLSGSLAIATGGLSNISSQLALLSQNVANASTANYACEVGTQSSVTSGGVGMGVQTGLAQRDVDAQLQASLTAQNAGVAGLTVTQTALQQIDNVQGTPGAGTDLSSMVGNLANAFSTLENDPSNQTQQQAVVSAGTALTTQINTIASTLSSTRQSAQDSIVAEVGTLNQSLATIGGLNQQIVAFQAAGISTADLENQRDAAVATLSSLVGVQVMTQPNGNDLLITSSGLSLPTDAASGPFSIGNASLGASTFYPGGGVPGIMLGSTDVTAQLAGGQIGANVTLRNQTLPTYQSELDEFSYTLSSRFAQEGLSLFTDATGAVPTPTGTPTQAGYEGYSSTIQVNPAVVANAALVRDGTQAVAASPTGAAAFTPNPPGGPAGFTGLITNVLNYALGSQAQSGVAWTPPATTGLGASGTLSAPFTAPADIASFAADFVAAQAQDSATATSQLTTDTAVQASLAGQVSAISGVSLDTQMSNMIALQNAYGANAKLISAVQALWNDLLAMVS